MTTPPDSPPPGSIPPPPPGPPPRRRVSPRVVALVGALVVALAGAGVLAAVLLTSDEASAEEVLREPVASAGANPFMDSVATGEDDGAALMPPDDTGGTFDGATPGLYGGTMDEGSCDSDQIVAFLEANPDKASAWAGVLGIEVDDIPDFVAGLTPLVLRSDTAVTNHGFENGQATVVPAVLQAGTAVLVDDFGTPVVKCYCGNPLTKPTSETVTYTGPRWTSFQPDAITIVDPSPVVINVFVVVDVDTGEAFGRPVGTDGSEDGPAPDDPTASTTTTTTTTTTTPAVPTDATYSATYTGDCPTTELTFTVTDGVVTAEAPGGSASGPVGPDGSFTVSSQGDTVTGTLDEDRVTATISGNCNGTIEGTRTG